MRRHAHLSDKTGCDERGAQSWLAELRGVTSAINAMEATACANEGPRRWAFDHDLLDADRHLHDR